MLGLVGLVGLGLVGLVSRVSRVRVSRVRVFSYCFGPVDLAPRSAAHACVALFAWRMKTLPDRILVLCAYWLQKSDAWLGVTQTASAVIGPLTK